MKLDDPVQRHKVGAELLDKEPAGALGRSEQYAPDGPWQLCEEAFLRGDCCDEGGLDASLGESLGRAGADRGDSRKRPVPPPCQLGRAVRARDDDPVIA